MIFRQPESLFPGGQPSVPLGAGSPLVANNNNNDNNNNENNDNSTNGTKTNDNDNNNMIRKDNDDNNKYPTRGHQPEQGRAGGDAVGSRPGGRYSILYHVI